MIAIIHVIAVFIGTKEYDKSTVSIEKNDRRKHMAIFGKSGVGKTTLIRNMALADIANGNGLTVIDPHGSLVEDLLESIPRHRTNDVIYLNPADPRLPSLLVLLTASFFALESLSRPALSTVLF